MSLGSLYIKYLQKYKHGYKAYWYGDLYRKKILETAPIKGNKSNVCEIHVLTSATDFLNLIWTLKSFYFFSKRNYSLCIHSDGTLTNDNIEVLLFHFPDSRIILKEIADKEMMDVLKRFPNSLSFRDTNHLAPKIFDFKYYLNADNMLLLDSDVLFFNYPSFLIDKIENSDELNYANKDAKYGYTIGADTKFSDFELTPFFNSGLCIIRPNSIQYAWIEEFLDLPDILSHFWRIEQTLFSLCSHRYGFKLLPEDYDVYLTNGLDGRQSRHYVGVIRHLMYKEGMAELRKKNFLKNIS